ncbi:unnamed protein product [Urochloa humidicola]
MPCSHTFHEHCILEWLRRNTACPLCRHHLPMEEELVDEENQGRRSRSRIFYNRGDGRYHVLWHYTEQPFAGGDDEQVDPEQERRTEHEAYLREALARWRDMVASSRITS